MSEQNISRTKRTSQAIDNFSFDEETLTKVFLPLEYDPSGSVKRTVTGDLTSRIVSSGGVSYIGEATLGSATSSAVWQVTKADTTTSPQTIKIAGTGAFDQIFDNYASLTYN